MLFTGRRAAIKLLQANVTRASDPISPMASPQDAELLYAQAALSFTQRDIEKIAAHEFAARPWRDILGDLYRRRETHIQQADDVLAQFACRYLARGSAHGSNKKGLVRVLEIGPGAGGGAKAVLDELFSKRVPVSAVRYTGVDVCRLSCRSTRRLLRKLYHPADVEVVRTTALSYMRSRASQGSVDLFLAGYSLHHNQAAKALLRAAMHLPKILEKLERKERRSFRRLVIRLMKSLAPRDDSVLQGLMREASVVMRSETGWEQLGSWFSKNSGEIVSRIADPRTEILTLAAKALRARGLMLIADPDGRSRFNRERILKPDCSLIAAANFCSRADTVRAIKELGLEIVEVHIQTAREDQGSRRINRPIRLEHEFWETPVEKLPDRVWKRIGRSESSDAHLGYIICARKP